MWAVFEINSNGFQKYKGLNKKQTVRLYATVGLITEGVCTCHTDSNLAINTVQQTYCSPLIELFPMLQTFLAADVL